MTVKVDSCSESANCIFLWKLSPSPPRLLLSNATAPAPAYLLPCRVLFFSLSSYHYFVIVKLSETVKNYKILLRISINKLICFPHEITLYFDVMESLEELRSDHPIMESTKSEEETVNLEYFGRYLTNEYEILERTLSYLNINDLISASHVTSSWKQVCERLLEKRKNLRWHIRCKCGAFRGHNFKNKINFKSSLALGFQLTNSKDEILNDLMENESYLCRSSIADDLAKGSNIPGVQDANMFIIKSCKLEVPYYTEKNELKFLDNAEACLLFPELEGFQVHVETYSPSEECDKLFSYPSIKAYSAVQQPLLLWRVAFLKW
ncbi:uncharacterized protein LOC135832559 isoform X2 [Planococcus citri]|uniref:uncharacterized protein LOC135832559 isoform X2 n=1 Tax=Planococcus citri TaxID=170843 RepID=UPI0031F7C90E